MDLLKQIIPFLEISYSIDLRLTVEFIVTFANTYPTKYLIYII